MKTLFRELVWSLVLVALLSAVSSLGIDRVRVDGASMAPTLASGQHLLANKLAYSGLVPRVFAGRDNVEDVIPNRGDIVIFHPPTPDNSIFVKRVVGLPGETVSLHNGTVYVDDAALDEPYIAFHDRSSMAPLHIPAGYIFVLGDNRPVSSDSRAWGLVPTRNIEGVAWLRYWPPHLASLVPFQSEH